MSTVSSSADGRSTTGPQELTRDGTGEVSANRRRVAIHVLGQHAGESSIVSELGERVTNWENDQPIEVDGG